MSVAYFAMRVVYVMNIVFRKYFHSTYIYSKRKILDWRRIQKIHSLLFSYIKTQYNEQKKVREKSRECHVFFESQWNSSDGSKNEYLGIF